MAIFGLKPRVNPLGKMSIFQLFKILVSIAQKGVFQFENIVEDIFLAYIDKKKKFAKSPFLDTNHGLTPLENWPFFDFLNFLFLQPREAMLRSRISEKTFSWPILRKKKVGKIAIFGHRPRVNPLEKMAIFDFLNFLF